jgi:hypothetical protein
MRSPNLICMPNWPKISSQLQSKINLSLYFLGQPESVRAEWRAATGKPFIISSCGLAWDPATAELCLNMDLIVVCLGNAKWCLVYPNTAVYNLPMIYIDHAPILGGS